MNRRIRLALAVAAVTAVAPALLLAPGLASAAAKPQAVAVTLQEFKIVVPSKLKPGPTVFTLHNRGQFPHDMVVVYHTQGTPFATPHVPRERRSPSTPRSRRAPTSSSATSVTASTRARA